MGRLKALFQSMETTGNCLLDVEKPFDLPSALTVDSTNPAPTANNVKRYLSMATGL